MSTVELKNIVSMIEYLRDTYPEFAMSNLTEYHKIHMFTGELNNIAEYVRSIESRKYDYLYRQNDEELESLLRDDESFLLEQEEQERKKEQERKEEQEKMISQAYRDGMAKGRKEFGKIICDEIERIKADRVQEPDGTQPALNTRSRHRHMM